MPIIEGTRELKQAQGEYDFAVDGGAVGAIVLRSAPSDSNGNDIPNGSIIEGGYIEVDTLVTSASGNTGTIAVNSEGAGDLLAAVVTSGAPWSTVGRKSIIPAFTGATTVKTSARRNLVVTVAVAALTAGKFRVVVFYK
ncbi:MAG: hypothetical protein JWO11_3883 [Nocardioides sp.]|nr:hypothetical protein [Nocardioides sp.]